MSLTVTAALWFLPFALPICIWAAWNDLAFMKIPNKSVVALIAVFLVIGLIALPLADYPWRLLHLVVIMVIGFALNMIGAIGAGDAKFAAAMAPFVALGDLRLFMVLLGTVLIAAYVTHRIFRAMPAIRARSEHWISWSAKKFPMGLALGSTLAFYLGLGVVYGA